MAAAAVAAAEASGALPPLAGPQRAALEGFFASLAAASLGPSTGFREEGGDFENFGKLAG